MTIEYVSTYVSSEDAERIYQELSNFLVDAVGDGVVTVMYGALSNIHADLWYKPMSKYLSGVRSSLCCSRTRARTP